MRKEQKYESQHTLKIKEIDGKIIDFEYAYKVSKTRCGNEQRLKETLLMKLPLWLTEHTRLTVS